MKSTRKIRNSGTAESLDLFSDSKSPPRGSSPLSLPQIRTLDSIADPFATLKRLQQVEWEFSAEDTSYLSHDIHPYPAKFIPQLPANLIAQLSVPGELVWDPFGGSGTTALEAILLERRALSSDANPLATLIAKTKASTLSAHDEASLRLLATELALSARDVCGTKTLLERMRPFWERKVPSIPNIEKWFGREAIAELAYIRHLIDQITPVARHDVGAVALSRTVQKMSFQDSETRYSSKPRLVKTGETIAVYCKELLYCLSRVVALGEVIGFREAHFQTYDAMLSLEANPLAHVGLSEGSVDLVVSSPPYPNATDYHLYHRFRMFWLGFDPREFASVEIGSHLRHQRQNSGLAGYLEEMGRCLANILRALRPGRYAALILGDCVFKGRTFSTVTEVGTVAAELGFEKIGTARRAIHATRRSFALPARRARHEHILLLRKPQRDCTFVLLPPNYEMHDYEKVLRKIEAENQLNRKITTANENLKVTAASLAVTDLRRLVFSHGFSSKEVAVERTWQAALENGTDQSRRKKESNYWLHGVHPYKGKFYPQLAASLINVSGARSGDVLLDPFCGSGTAVTEGALRGLDSYGCDINPLAVKIARVKSGMLRVAPAMVDHAVTQLTGRLSQLNVSDHLFQDWLESYSAAAQRELISWFPRAVLRQFAGLLNEIRQTPSADLQELFEVILSGIVRHVSEQDPKDLRIRRRKEPLGDVDVRELFRVSLLNQYQKIVRFFRIRNSAPSPLGTSLIWQADARDPGGIGHHLGERSVDLVVTSPPYATALPYVDTYRLSHLLLFGDAASSRKPLEQGLTGSREITPADRASVDRLIDADQFGVITSEQAKRIVTNVYRGNVNANVGFRRKNQAALLYRYFTDMTRILDNVSVALRTQGQVFVVLGNNVTEVHGKATPIDSIGVIKEIAANLGWLLERSVPISVTKEDFMHQKNSITVNSILWFRSQ